MLQLASQRSIQSSTPEFKNMGYTQIYFGENQLSPRSIGISPLATTHPSHLQLTLVRASIPLSRDFTLVMVSSHGFGSSPFCIQFALLTLAFTLLTDIPALRLQNRETRRFILQQARGHPLRSSHCLLAFNFSNFSFPFRGTLSPFPHGTSSLSVTTHVQPQLMVELDSHRISRVPCYLGYFQGYS